MNTSLAAEQGDELREIHGKHPFLILKVYLLTRNIQQSAKHGQACCIMSTLHSSRLMGSLQRRWMTLRGRKATSSHSTSSSTRSPFSRVVPHVSNLLHVPVLPGWWMYCSTERPGRVDASRSEPVREANACTLWKALASCGLGMNAATYVENINIP